MKDQFGFSPSDMTTQGWVDYQRKIAEIADQRDDRTSRYNGVSRVHCTDGYVDVGGCYGAVKNGSSVDKTVDDFRSETRRQKEFHIYDYHHRR